MRAAAMPVIIWAAHCAVAYGFTALACARGMSAAVSWVVGVASVAALVALAIIAVPAGVRAARTPHFTQFMKFGLGALAATAVVWEASSLLWLPACD